MADVPVYLLVGYGLCWGTKGPTPTPTPAKPINIPQGFCYLCQSLTLTGEQFELGPDSLCIAVETNEDRKLNANLMNSLLENACKCR